jgi:ABC-2 type transport system permease protein
MKAAPSLDTVEQPAGAEVSVRPPSSGGSVLIGLRTLYVLTLRQHLHGKRWIVLAILFLLPAALAAIVRATAPDAPSIILEFLFAFMFIPQALLPLVALLYATGMIQDELEEQTITYLLIRPIPKWALYFVKLLATVTTTVLLAAVFTALTYAAVYLGGDTRGENIPLRCLKAVSVHALAVVAYCCLFGLMSLLTKRSLLAGIIYILIFEWLLANLPFSIRLATVIYYARMIAYRTMEFVLTLPRGTQDVAAEAWGLDIKTDPKLLEHPQLATCVIVLACGSLLCTLLAALLCSQREFYVKTPEKN